MTDRTAASQDPTVATHDSSTRSAAPPDPCTGPAATTMARSGWVAAALAVTAAAWGTALVVNRSLRRVEGPSMLPGLAPGDLVVTRPRAWPTPIRADRVGLRRGDLVVARLGGVQAIKRVVGLPGDSVVLGDGHLHVDGSWWTLPGAVLVDEDLHMEVGANQVALLGDNRARSTDSRTLGTVLVDDVARVVVASVRPWRRVGAGIGMCRTHGPRRREAVRVVVVDDDDRTLLFRVRDRDGGPDEWWETPGGGLHRGEAVAAAAAREVAEEVGAPHGPIVDLDHVTTRTSHWWGTTIERVEHHMATRVTEATVDSTNWTAGERATQVDWAWLSADEVASLDEPTVPGDLAGMLARALSALRG